MYCFQKQFFQLESDGPTLEIWPNGNAGFLLFYPGSMLGPGHYFVLLNALRRAGFAIAALHLKGHGRHCPPLWQLDQFTFAELLQQGLLAERWLMRHFGRQIVACGHSQGGILALAHAAKSQALACAIAIAAIFPQMPEAIALTRFAPLFAHRETIVQILRKIACYLPRLPLPLPFYLQLGRIIFGKCHTAIMGPEKGRMTYPLKYLVSLFTAVIPVMLHCPFLLYGAANDALFTQAIMEQTFARILTPQKELIFLPAGGHMLPLNPYWADFLARSMAEHCAGLGVCLNLHN